MDSPAHDPRDPRLRIGALCMLVAMLVGMPLMLLWIFNDGIAAEYVGRDAERVDLDAGQETVAYGDTRWSYAQYGCVITDRDTDQEIAVRPVQDGYERRKGKVTIREVARFDSGSGHLLIACENRLRALGPPTTQSDRFRQFLPVLGPLALGGIGLLLMRGRRPHAGQARAGDQ